MKMEGIILVQDSNQYQIEELLGKTSQRCIHNSLKYVEQIFLRKQSTVENG